MKFDQAGNPVLDQFSEEGFVDLTFRIVDLVEKDERYHFRLAASYKDRVVGMGVQLRQDIKSGFDAQVSLIKEHVYREGARFTRTGDESDRLMQAIADLYKSTFRPQRMIEDETFTVIALHQGDLDLKTQPVKLKLFGRDSAPFDENAYYESFFNVDLSACFVYWNEKDTSYRESLLQALGR